MTPQPVLIDDATLALMRKRVSVLVAARDAERRPHLMRALGCRVSADRRRVTMIMARRTSASVLADIEANGAIAVVISEPTTHRTAQLKGGDATIEPMAPGDLALIEAHAERFADEVEQMGFARALAHAIHDREGELVAVTFTPLQAFEQTPGPRAGRAIGAPAPQR